MKLGIIIIIGLIIIGFLLWQLIEVDNQRVELANKVKIQEKQIEAFKVHVSETEKERDEKQKKLDGLISDLKDWANKNQSALSANQYSTFIDCNTRVGGGFSCFSY